MKRFLIPFFKVLLFFLLSATVSFAQQAPDWQWTKKVGSSGVDNGQHIALTKRGWMFVTGRYTGTVDFRGQFGNIRIGGAGSTDMFLALYDDLGYARWVRRGGG
ncbi:MAG: hypothetical protein LPK19_06550, partial [Hymenobacteraceae bacterium]|nr:hypothetical protein [Hymenobacteraceae bacterium]MDX5395862.1 hypothetical protein [Hymenobacteraceae bacterium]MDX5511917.1 hypothetical protein [Hymenobacteraceae bacterium]